MERRATLNQDHELAFGVTKEQNASEELERTIQRVGERRESNQTSMMNIIESRLRESNRIQFANGTSRNQNEREGRAKEKGIQRSGEKGAFPRVSFTTNGVIHDQGCLRVQGCEGNTMETSPQIQTKTKFKGNIIETSQYYQTCATKYHWKNSMSPKIHCKGVLDSLAVGVHWIFSLVPRIQIFEFSGFHSFQQVGASHCSS
jgi:hypothetical protein